MRVAIEQASGEKNSSMWVVSSERLVRRASPRARNASNACLTYTRCVKRIDATMPRLDLRDLQVALAIEKAGSTARAAKLLHLTQPAVSRALLLAESKLGLPLFQR